MLEQDQRGKGNATERLQIKFRNGRFPLEPKITKGPIVVPVRSPLREQTTEDQNSQAVSPHLPFTIND